jgi:hypothetical protein
MLVTGTGTGDEIERVVRMTRGGRGRRGIRIGERIGTLTEIGIGMGTRPGRRQTKERQVIQEPHIAAIHRATSWMAGTIRRKTGNGDTTRTGPTGTGIVKTARSGWTRQALGWLHRIHCRSEMKKQVSLRTHLGPAPGCIRPIGRGYRDTGEKLVCPRRIALLNR